MSTKPLLALILTVLVAICGVHAQAQTQSDDAKMGPGDRVKVTVLGPDDLGAQTSIDSDGNISLPLIGTYKMAGKTPVEATTEVRAALRKYVKDPQVAVEVVQKAAWIVVVSGKVKKAGAYAVSSHTSLVELMALAGGPDANADLSSVNLIRSGTKSPQLVNLQGFMDGKALDANPTMRNGDLIMVPERISTLGTIFVLGEVRRMGPYELRQGMKIHEAISEAGGITDLADPQAATVTSKNKEPQKFDLVKALAQDPAEDKTLSSGDTIYIQTTSGSFNIYGAVNRPGSYNLKGPIPLTDALAMAGGYTGQAKIQDARILRSSQQKSIPVNLANVEKLKAENIAVLPGDTVVVPERREKTNIWQVIGTLGSLGWLLR